MASNNSLARTLPVLLGPSTLESSLLYFHFLHLILGRKPIKLPCSWRIWSSTKFTPAVSPMPAAQTLSRFEFNSKMSGSQSYVLHVPFDLESNFLLLRSLQWDLCFIILEILARTPIMSEHWYFCCYRSSFYSHSPCYSHSISLWSNEKEWVHISYGPCYKL